jgi:nucleoside phosphorylase
MTPPTVPSSANYGVDFAIITALEKEAKAVVSRLENRDTKRFEDRNIRTYHCGTIPIQEAGRSYRVVVVLLPSMGEISAANAVTDTIADWNPRFVLMVGIAGGFAQDDLDLGDVVVADQVVGYDYGKVVKGGIKPRDRVYPASALLLERVRNFWDEAWVRQVNTPRPGNAHRDASKLFVGPIASGNKVIASAKFREQLLKRWSKLIAVEMEAEGVYAAVFDRPQIRGTLVIRGISDMADERKGDAWQVYAANAAAAFAVEFLKSGPVEPLPAQAAAPGPPVVPEDDLLLVQRQLANARDNLRLIQERKAEFVFSTDVPLQLVKEERRWLDEIAELERRLALSTVARPSGGPPPGMRSAAPGARGQGPGAGQPGGGAQDSRGDEVSSAGRGGGGEVGGGGGMPHPTVFISYSHKDEEWKDRLVTHLGVLQQQGLLEVWDDRRIGAGEDWQPEIEKAIAAARVAILLISANFLTSKFILGEEVPRLLERRSKEGLRVFPVIVKPCAWQQVKWLARMQARPKDGKPLSGGSDYQIDADLAAIAAEVHRLL